MIGATATEVAGGTLSLGLMAAICGFAVAFTYLATRHTFAIARTRVPDWAAALVAVVVALLVFAGGWLIVGLWWIGTRSRRLVHRLAS